MAGVNGPGRSRRQLSRIGRHRAGRRGPMVIHPVVVPGFTRTGGFFGHAVGELKFHDIDIDDAAVAAGGTIAIDSVNKIPQGVTEVQRIGRKCTLRSINWRFDIALPEVDAVADPPANDIVRVIVYLDKQANGATAAVTDIVETADYQSFNNLANKHRFRTLMDRSYDLNYLTLASDGAGLVSAGAVIIRDSFFKKINVPVEFSATTGAITEIRSNNIGILLLGKSGASAFTSKMRIRFSDT